MSDDSYDPKPTVEFIRGLIERERPFYSLNALTMYALTLIAELPVIFVRVMFVALLASILVLVEDHTLPRWSGGWVWVALIPTFWSMLALVTPLGSAWWWRTRAGGREPSSREQLAFKDAVELLQANSDSPLPVPKHWFVIDTPHPDAAAVGDALMLSRGLLETEHLPAVLAHELGHLATPDGRLTAALNRLVIFSNPFGHSTEEDRDAQGHRSRGHWIVRMQEAHQRFEGPSDLEPMVDVAYGFLKLMFYASLFAKGGLGPWLTRPAWGRYWRAREYEADRYAANLGQAEELADFLEVHALIHDHPVPFMWLTEHTHPPTELRIDKLRNTEPGSEPASPPGDGPLPGPSEPGPEPA